MVAYEGTIAKLDSNGSPQTVTFFGNKEGQREIRGYYLAKLAEGQTLPEAWAEGIKISLSGSEPREIPLEEDSWLDSVDSNIRYQMWEITNATNLRTVQ
jgi:hypothetical protein